jgi:ATP-binding cassette subfamily B (MDR/TAP) protein 7
LDISKGYEIKFENVVFGYTDSRPILNGVSFTIKTGDSFAFVGPSGCGKSTIIRLLFRFFDPDQGRITINQIDIKDIKLESLRKILGVVPQDTILFNQTIGDNIRYGKTDASINQVHSAARYANLHNIITESFPEGYNTQVGERGMMISGGERQRVQLARVFLKNPPILLFDEPTSALDLNTEISIMATIRNILQEPAIGTLPRSSLFIAHRLATIKDCKHIVVLSSGKIKEEGTHTELLRLGGVYNEMWNAQQERVDKLESK